MLSRAVPKLSSVFDGDIVHHFTILCYLIYQLQNANVFRGCYFQEGSEVKMDMKVDTAYERSLQTVVEWVSREVNSNKTQVFFRTYAPVHFRLVISSFFVLANLFLVL